MWILSCSASMGYLSRMTQWKLQSKSADSRVEMQTDRDINARSGLGLFSYPVLQAADILLYQATHVPVGHDQVQHLEFAREMAKSFNTAHGRLFTEPQTIMYSIEGLSYDPLKRPGVSNLLSLMAYMDPNRRSEEQIAADGRSLTMRAFKEEVSDVIIKGLTDIKAKFDFFSDTTQWGHLREIISLGNEKARLKANSTMIQVRNIAGLDSI
ncbi:MAG: hypothetical protein LQ352_003128 [Teloschistes flavicans]|nr:MAG: hypothetical protein LQ352_003128 [Teloschistes flavicans]